MRFHSRQEFPGRKRPGEIVVSLCIRHGVVFTSAGSDKDKWNRTGSWIGPDMPVQRESANRGNRHIAHNQVGLFGAKGRECSGSVFRKRYAEVGGEKPGQRIACNWVVVYDQGVTLNFWRLRLS